MIMSPHKIVRQDPNLFVSLYHKSIPRPIGAKRRHSKRPLCTTMKLLVGSEMKLPQKLEDLSCRDQFSSMDKVLLLCALIPKTQTPTTLQPSRLTTSSD